LYTYNKMEDELDKEYLYIFGQLYLYDKIKYTKKKIGNKTFNIDDDVEIIRYLRNDGSLHLILNNSMNIYSRVISPNDDIVTTLDEGIVTLVEIIDEIYENDENIIYDFVKKDNNMELTLIHKRYPHICIMLNGA
jgi:hypothetical protein